MLSRSERHETRNSTRRADPCGGAEEFADRGGISTTDGLLCCSILNDDSVGVYTGGTGEGKSLTGDKGLGTLIAEGGAFLMPFSIVSRGRVGAVVTTVETASSIGLLMVKYLLFEDVGALKLGIDGE